MKNTALMKFNFYLEIMVFLYIMFFNKVFTPNTVLLLEKYK